MASIDPIPGGHYRVIVIESDARTSTKDFRSRSEAIEYANDAASESDDNPPVATVYDDQNNVIHRGRHYAA